MITNVYEGVFHYALCTYELFSLRIDSVQKGGVHYVQCPALARARIPSMLEAPNSGSAPRSRGARVHPRSGIQPSKDKKRQESLKNVVTTSAQFTQYLSFSQKFYVD